MIARFVARAQSPVVGRADGRENICLSGSPEKQLIKRAITFPAAIVYLAPNDGRFATVDAALASFFTNVGSEMKGVSQQSYDRLAQTGRAQKRAREIARAMPFDLNGDGVVTREELEIGLADAAPEALKNETGVEPTREQLSPSANS